MEDGNAREILKRGIHKIELVTHTADARVGMKARNDRIHLLCPNSEE